MMGYYVTYRYTGYHKPYYSCHQISSLLEYFSYGVSCTIRLTIMDI